MIGRPYQTESIQAIYNYLKTKDGNPCLVLPTGSGKSFVLSKICDDMKNWGKRVICLAHRKELIEQLSDTLAHFLGEEHVGINGASLKRRDTEQDIIVAQIQSVHTKAQQFGLRHLILIDEAHLVSEVEGSRYNTFISEIKKYNPNIRVVGLSATPCRMYDGALCGEGRTFTDICYEANVGELIQKGYLSKLRSKSGTEVVDLSSVHIRGGEFITEEMQGAFDKLIEPACKEIIALTAERKSGLIFCASVKQAELVAQIVGGVCVTGETPAGEREQIVLDFKAGRIKYLVNVGVYTTGFDAPNVDFVVMLMSTMSTSLYVQIIGRGLRTCEGKKDCLILDYGENILRHGAIDEIQIKEKKEKSSKEPSDMVKKCPACQEIIAIAYASCPICGHEFMQEMRIKHQKEASTEDILSQQREEMTIKVAGVMYSTYFSQRKNYLFKVEYQLQDGFKTQCDYFNVKNPYSIKMFSRWWKERSTHPVPKTINEAYYLACLGALSEPVEITVSFARNASEHDKIEGYNLFGVDKGKLLSDEDFFMGKEVDEIPF